MELERKTVPKPENRLEWLAARQPYFNASSASVLFDRHPHQTAGDYAAVKLGGEEKSGTRAMTRGQRLEDVIARWWADEYGDVIYEPKELFIAGRIMATVDRINDPGSNYRPFPVEIKTTMDRDKEPKQYWIDQCQAVALCVGAPQIELVWFDGWLDLHHRTIDADPDFQAELVERAERFMAAIDLGFAPDWVQLSYENLSAIHPAGGAGAIPLDDDGLDLLRDFEACRQVRIEAEKAEDVYKGRVAELLMDADAGSWHGIEVVTWKKSKDGTRFDADRFAEEHPDLFAEYQVTKKGGRTMRTHLQRTF